jgi:hypothetical protein
MDFVVASALCEVLGVIIQGVEHTCPRCYSQKVAKQADGSWRCSNCPWSGEEADTIGSNQSISAPTIPIAPKKQGHDQVWHALSQEFDQRVPLIQAGHITYLVNISVKEQSGNIVWAGQFFVYWNNHKPTMNYNISSNCDIYWPLSSGYGTEAYLHFSALKDRIEEFVGNIESAGLEWAYISAIP